MKQTQVVTFWDIRMGNLSYGQKGVSKTHTSKTQTSDPKNSDPLGVSKTQTLWVSRKLRPEKLRPSGCLENSDPKKTRKLEP